MMIELEIQGLAANREGLLIEIGRLAVASGFTLRRQRLLQDPHGILLTMVVHGPARRERALAAALDDNDRLTSFRLLRHDDDSPQPHFAASRTPLPYETVTPPAPAPRPPAAVPASSSAKEAADTPAAIPGKASADHDPGKDTGSALAADGPTLPSAPPAEPKFEPEFEFDFIQPTRRPAAAPVIPVAATPFIERIPLGPDEPAVEAMLGELERDYPQIVPRLLTLEGAVAESARESSLTLAGQRTGAWVYQRDHAMETGLDLPEAIARVGTPALHALVEVAQQGTQLHIQNSPLCTKDGHSGCSFYSGFLEGLLGSAIASGEPSIFALCCRSYGADECVLAISQ